MGAPDSALGKTLSLNPERAQAQLLHALRAADTVESRAVAALIKRGKLDVTISGKQMFYRGQEVAGRAIPGTNQVILFRAALGNTERAAGVLAYEAKHFLQNAGTRVNPYHRGLEFEAIKWQARVDSSMHWMGDAEVWERVNRVYWNVSAPPSTWTPNLGGGIR